MARLINPFEQYFDGAGEPLVSGLLDFFESGSSTVRKTTYLDSAETIANSNPVILGGDGRAPNVFGSGTYNVILRTADGAQILARDPVGGDTGTTFGADWISDQVYGVSDVVRDDNTYWISLVGDNQGNQPSLDGGSNWIETDFTQIENIATNTANIATNTADILLKANKAGDTFTGQVNSTAGDLNLKTNTALSDAAATLTAAQLIGGEFTITPTVDRIQTTDTAANIIAALSGSVDNSNFEFTVINLAAFDVTIAAGVGVTLVGNMVVNDGSVTFRARRLTSSTVSVTRLETGAGSSSSINLQPVVPTTSGTSIDFTGIPANVNRLTVSLENVSIDANVSFWVQLGDAGGVETTGYEGTAANITGATASTAFTSAFEYTGDANSAVERGGIITIVRLSGNTWASDSSLASDATAVSIFKSTGTKTLSAELTTVRLTSSSGAANFDNGNASISWEF